MAEFSNIWGKKKKKFSIAFLMKIELGGQSDRGL